VLKQPTVILLAHAKNVQKGKLQIIAALFIMVNLSGDSLHSASTN
jgi:hypothetical protein